MDADHFYRSRQADWKTLDALVASAEKKGGTLNPQQVEVLGKLYRAATADLAIAQRDYPKHKLLVYLNRLVGRAHAVIYQGEPLAVRRLKHFATHGFPQVYRETGWFILTAALFFILPALISAVIINQVPGASRWLLPPAVAELEPMIKEKELWTNIPIEDRPYTSTFIMSNNIQVSFLAFGSGVLGGVLTLWVMVMNGLLLGGLTGLTAYYDVGFELWTFVIGHGMVELSVIFMAGGAGLSLGWAILRPGLHRRRDALAAAAGKSVRLIAGAVPLLIFAGLIEGFISPSQAIPAFVKWTIGIGTGTLFYLYVFLAGRREPAM